MTRPSLMIRRLAAGIAAGAALTGIACVPACALTVGGSAPFSLTPAPLSDGQARPYFQMTLSPGRSAADGAVITNEGVRTATLDVSASIGVTAPNSGSAFTGFFRPCAGTACWVTGLPAAVTLGPGASRLLRFTVTVPAGTRQRQYLAGITAEPAKPAAAVGVGGNGQAPAKAIVITQISVGVAVTVGPLTHLRTGLKIPAVTAGTAGPIPRLDIQLRNTGQTFAKAAGEASCATGGKLASYQVNADTILPGDTAVVPVNATGLRPGTNPACRVTLRYGGRLSTAWSGTVSVPGVTRQRVIHTGPGTYSTLPPPPGFPAWAIALIVAAAVTIITLATIVILLLRRQSDPPPGTGESPERRIPDPPRGRK